MTDLSDLWEGGWGQEGGIDIEEKKLEQLRKGQIAIPSKDRSKLF